MPTSMPSVDSVTIRRSIISQVAKGGIALIAEADMDGLILGYTVGLQRNFQLPELIMCGPFNPSAIEAVILNAAGIVQEQKCSFEHGAETPHIGPTAFTAINATPYQLRSDIVYMKQFYGTEELKVQQLVWADTNGGYPWDDSSEFQKGGTYHDLQRLFGGVD